MLTEKPDFPALLPAGVHSLTIEELRSLCVDSFPLSRTRAGIMDGIELIVRRLRAIGLVGELWVDGSFMTRKIDPKDSDTVFFIHARELRRLTRAQRDVFNWLSSNLTRAHKCDSYVSVRHRRGHPDYRDGKQQEVYWRQQFGTDRGNAPRGIATIRLPRARP